MKGLAIKKALVNPWTQYYVPITLILFGFISLEREVTNTDGGYDRLFGLPWGYITGNFGCTGCYEVYILPMIGDLFIYLVFVFLLFKGLLLMGLKLKTNWFASLIGLIISSFIIFCFFFFPDTLSFELWNHIPFSTVRYNFY